MCVGVCVGNIWYASIHTSLFVCVYVSVHAYKHHDLVFECASRRVEKKAIFPLISTCFQAKRAFWLVGLGNRQGICDPSPIRWHVYIKLDATFASHAGPETRQETDANRQG